MATDRFMIAPFNTGLQTNLKPWLVPEDAFQFLSNAYVWRGRVRKRFGSKLTGSPGTTPLQSPLHSRLRVLVGATNGAGTLAGAVPGSLFKVGQQFSIGDIIYTVFNPAGGPQAMLRSAGATVTYTYDITNGNFNFVGGPIATNIYFYPADSVQSIMNYESGYFNQLPVIAFDTQFAYTFAGGGWERIDPATRWNGDDLDFYWGSNWIGLTNNPILFVSNFNATIGVPGVNDDPMYYYNGATFTAFAPLFHAGPNQTVSTCRLIVPFKNRLVLLGTVELNAVGNNVAYGQRARYSHAGSPLSVSAWYDNDQAGYTGGGFVDATSQDTIVTCSLFRNRLIVYFTNSVWELVYTGIDTLPFAWQQINSELGSESPFSIIPFDNQTMAIGSTGVNSCNGVQVSRIDNKIPNQIFQILQSGMEPERVAGIRDFYLELAYWTIPEVSADQPKWPSALIIYNYVNDSWATFRDSITAFGYFFQEDGPTWITYGNNTWAEMNVEWNAGVISANQRVIIFGNQQGFILEMSPYGVPRNAPSLQVTNMVSNPIVATATIINHNLEMGSYVHLENMTGITFDYRDDESSGIFLVDSVIDDNTVVLFEGTFAGVYLGGGTAALVSQIQIVTKDFNPYVGQARNFYLQKVDFAVERTPSNIDVDGDYTPLQGQIDVDYVLNQAEGLQMLEQAQISGTLVGSGTLETTPYELVPFEANQDTLWHSLYFQVDGEFIRLIFEHTNDQILNKSMIYNDFTLEGMVLYTTPTSSRLQ